MSLQQYFFGRASVRHQHLSTSIATSAEHVSGSPPRPLWPTLRLGRVVLGSISADRRRSQKTAPVVENNNVAIWHPASERYEVAVAPDIGRDVIAGIDGCRE